MLKDAWTLAIETLSWIQMEKLSEKLALSKTVAQLGIKEANAVRYAYALVCETIRRKNLIDKLVDDVVKPKNITEFNLGIQAFLRLYVYQTRIINNWNEIDLKEAKRIAKIGRAILGWRTMLEIEPFLGFLLTRSKEQIVNASSDEEKLSFQTFHPTWFVKYCINLLGRHEAISFLKANIEPPSVFIRLNTLKAPKEEIKERLKEENICTEKVTALKHTYKIIDSKKRLAGTSSFSEGLFYIQDKASCFAAEVADPNAGMTILDVCAAPGAKTTYLAQLMQNRGAIYSVDFSKRRLRVWKNAVSRMGVTIAEPLLGDARNPLPLELKADIVVLDPPCTSTGAFGKLPSAKWRLTPHSIEKMSEIQWEMITSCAEKVKEKGIMVYSTCSITIEENELIIERFLKSHPDFTLEEIGSSLGLPGMRDLSRCRRLYPHIHESNGFFIAKLMRAGK